MRCISEYIYLMGLLMMLIRLIGAATEEQSSELPNKTPIKLVWASEGDNVNLPCDITPPTPQDTVSMVLWFKDNAEIPLYSLDARNGSMASAIHWAVSDDLGGRTYFQVGDGHRAKLKVTKVTLNDQGIFRCRVDFVNSPTRNFRVNLTLVEQPSRPVIYDGQGREVTGVGGPFLEGYEVALTCQVAGGRPKPSVTWWKDGKLLDGVVDTSPTVSTRFTLNYLYIHQVTKSLWGAKLECRVQSEPMRKPIIREVPLDIYLKPTVVKITLSEDQIFAGRPIAAKCETWGSSPAAKIIWKLGKHEISDPNIVSTTQRANLTISKLALVLNKDDNGKELICRAENPRFPGGVLEEIKIFSDIFYAPVVVARLATGYVLDTLREGDDLKLICDVQSHPPPSQVIWYHDNQLLKHNVSAGLLLASESLTFRILTLKHAGEYSCMATNTVGETYSAPLFIHVKYAPRCKEGEERREITAARHERLLLKCEVEALPDDYIRFSWTYNGSIGEVLPISNSRIESKGLVSMLEYSPSTDTDYGTLACWASNSIGQQRTPCIFNIVSAKSPQSPLDCSLHNESSLEVNCIPGSDGGSPQHFVLEVRGSFRNSEIDTLQTPQNDQGLVGESSPVYQDMNPTPNFQLHDLEPGYDYTVYIYAVNGCGWSKPALLKHIRVSDPVDKKIEKSGIFLKDLKKTLPQASSENMIIAMIIALTGIGAVALVLVGIGVIIGVAVCRKDRIPLSWTARTILPHLLTSRLRESSQELDIPTRTDALKEQVFTSREIAMNRIYFTEWSLICAINICLISIQFEIIIRMQKVMYKVMYQISRVKFYYSDIRVRMIFSNSY